MVNVKMDWLIYAYICHLKIHSNKGSIGIVFLNFYYTFIEVNRLMT